MTTKKNTQNPPKWVNVYPQGTKEGDEEQKLFISLARHAKYEWRSVSAMSAESGLSKKRVEEILAKYYKKGMVFQNPKQDEQWGYWERVPHMLKNDADSISDKDHKKRIDGIVKDDDDCCGTGKCPSGGGCSNCSPSKVDYVDLGDQGSLAADKKVDERWLPPSDEECGWIPIRPRGNVPSIVEVFEAEQDRKVFYVDVPENSKRKLLEKIKEQFEKKKADANLRDIVADGYEIDTGEIKKFKGKFQEADVKAPRGRMYLTKVFDENIKALEKKTFDTGLKNVAAKVELLPGAENLGEVDDAEYFRKQ